jgi:hypothetical protein
MQKRTIANDLDEKVGAVNNLGNDTVKELGLALSLCGSLGSLGLTLSSLLVVVDPQLQKKKKSYEKVRKKKNKGEEAPSRKMKTKVFTPILLTLAIRSAEYRSLAYLLLSAL